MDVIMPQLGETVLEGTVTRWYKKVGDNVRADEALFDVETEKVATEIPSPASGVLAEILVGEGATAKVGVRLAVINESGGEVAADPESYVRAASPDSGVRASAAFAASAPPHAVPPAGNRLSPVVRRLLAEHGMTAGDIKGSGRDGRIKRDDVRAHIGRAAAAGTTVNRAATGAGTQKRVPLNAIRRRTAGQMVKSWTSVPHVLQAVEVDFSRIEDARRAAGAAFREREGFTLTYLPFIATAAAAALAKFPHLNASVEDKELIVHERINLGIAVDLSFEGLVVPVVKDVHGKPLLELAREIHDLVERARANRLKPDEMTEATYTLSNSGVFGTLITAPIINPPQVAILSTDGVRKKPVVVESPDGDSIAIRPVGVLAQTFDHRAVDGAYSAAYLRELKTVIESPVWAGALAAARR
jgi:2-oxoglutarate dehydrogenase E2 component (dihydrolipoamide succinyltransferase)